MHAYKLIIFYLDFYFEVRHTNNKVYLNSFSFKKKEDDLHANSVLETHDICNRNIAMEFRVVDSGPSDGFNSLIDSLRVHRMISEGSSAEALIINCQMILHTVSEETISYNPPLSLRSLFLESLRSLEPNLVTLVDEDADFTSSDVVGIVLVIL